MSGNSEGESAACSALADSYMADNDILQSVKYLEESIFVSFCFLFFFVLIFYFEYFLNVFRYRPCPEHKSNSQASSCMS